MLRMNIYPNDFACSPASTRCGLDSYEADDAVLALGHEVESARIRSVIVPRFFNIRGGQGIEYVV